MSVLRGTSPDRGGGRGPGTLAQAVDVKETSQDCVGGRENSVRVRPSSRTPVRSVSHLSRHVGPAQVGTPGTESLVGGLPVRSPTVVVRGTSESPLREDETTCSKEQGRPIPKFLW